MVYRSTGISIKGFDHLRTWNRNLIQTRAPSHLYSWVSRGVVLDHETGYDTHIHTHRPEQEPVNKTLEGHLPPMLLLFRYRNLYKLFFLYIYMENKHRQTGFNQESHNLVVGWGNVLRNNYLAIKRSEEAYKLRYGKK